MHRGAHRTTFVALPQLRLAELLQGRLPEAREHLVESLSVRIRIQDGHGLVSAFTDLAALALEERDFARAALLFGAVDAACARSDAELEPFTAELSERAAVAARGELGDDSFARLREEGRKLGVEEAAALARAERATD